MIHADIFRFPSAMRLSLLAICGAAVSGIAVADDTGQPSPEEMAETVDATLPRRPWHLANIWWEFDKPIERFVEPTSQLRTSYTNAKSARNFGIELKGYFSKTPSAVSFFHVNGSGTAKFCGWASCGRLLTKAAMRSTQAS